jgi:hypothetical protein
MPDGRIVIARFDPARAIDGALMAFNGPMPGFDEARLLPGRRLQLAMPDTSGFDALQRAQNLPATLQRTRITVPRPPSGNGGGGGPY